MAEALCDMAVRSGRHSLPYAAPAAHTADWAAPDIAPGPGWHSLP